MSLVEHCRLIEGSRKTGRAVCVHTLHHRGQDGKPTGSWTETKGPYGIRIACGVCDKLFGYTPKEAGRTEDELYEAYLEQQRRRACPGCGEEPFLG